MTISSSPITNIHAWSKPEWQGQRPDQKGYFGIISVGHDYTATLGTKMLKGRDFEEGFNDSTSVLLNEAAVDYMELDDPVGTTLRLGEKDYTVAGVIRDMVMTSPYSPSNRTVFMYIPDWTSNVLIRLPRGGGLSAVMKDVEGVFKAHNPAFPFAYSFVDQEFSKKFANEELIGTLANLFSVLAIFISGLGLFGLSAFAAEQRSKEVGIRKVMGASVINILTLFSKDFSKLVLIAFLLAAPLTWWFMHKWLIDYAYRITIEWWMIAGGGLLALTLTWLIVGIQAMRAAMVNPSQSLRAE